MKRILLFKNFLFCFIILTLFYNVNGQVLMPTGSESSTITTCNTTFYDMGGGQGNHGANQSSSITFIPTIAGNAISVEFSSFALGECAELTIYDGNNATADEIATYNNFISPVGIEITASSDNPTGALHITFTTTTCPPEAGWAAQVSCRAPCQNFSIALNSNIADDMVIEDNIPYLNLCKDECVTFEIDYTFPHNNNSYNQMASNTDIIWKFNSETIDDQATITRCFDEARGWDFTAYAIDANECYSSNMIKGRIRVAENPTADINIFEDICDGNQSIITVGVDDTDDVYLVPCGNRSETTLSRGDTVFLPDGNDICYETELVFNVFDEGQTLESIDDLLGVSLWMEHSYLGDLSIRIECPNGQIAGLKAHAINEFIGYTPTGTIINSCSSSGGSAHLGHAPDPWSATDCYTTPGVAYKYTFTPDGESCFGNSGPAETYTENINGCFASGTTLQASPAVLGDNGVYYGPYETFNNLIGCPLNGAWTIIVCDHLSSDNGYVFGWEIALNQEILPSSWEYTVDIDTVVWDGNGATTYADLDGMITHPGVGDHEYSFTIIDDYGCEFTEEFEITILPSPTPDILAEGDTITLCQGESVELDANFDTLGTQYRWNTGATQNTINVNTTGKYSVICSTENDEHTLTCNGYDTVFVNVNPPPNPNFTTDITNSCAPITVQMNNQTTENLFNTTYLWKVLAIDGSSTHFSTEENPSFELIDPNTYDVKLIVTNNNTCTDSTTRASYITAYPPSPPVTIAETACDTFIYNHEIYTESGTYECNLENHNGCDSIVTLNLTINNSTRSNIYETACNEFIYPKFNK